MRENLSFEEALEIETKRMRENYEFFWHYKNQGFYYNQVKAYLREFSNTKVCLFDEFKDDAVSFVQKIYEFLMVDDKFNPDVKKEYNISGMPKYKILTDLLLRENRIKSAIKPFSKLFFKERIIRYFKKTVRTKFIKKVEMKPEIKKYLKNIYRDDVLKLQDLIQKDLSMWL